MRAWFFLWISYPEQSVSSGISCTSYSSGRGLGNKWLSLAAQVTETRRPFGYLMVEPGLIKASALLAVEDRSSFGSMWKAPHALLSECRCFEVPFQMLCGKTIPFHIMLSNKCITWLSWDLWEMDKKHRCVCINAGEKSLQPFSLLKWEQKMLGAGDYPVDLLGLAPGMIPGEGTFFHVEGFVVK